MKGNGILLVTTALQERLRQALVASQVPGSVFVGPLDDQDAAGAALILFLYRVVPNQALRNTEHRVPSGVPSPPVRVFHNALPLDLYFLVTVGTVRAPGEETLLRALGFVMQAMQTNPDLTGTAVGEETVHVTLEPLGTEEVSRIWALFPTANYRTSIVYLASPVWIDPLLPETVAAPVMQDQLFSGQKVVEAVS